jgi:hypothetical protein
MQWDTFSPDISVELISIIPIYSYLGNSDPVKQNRLGLVNFLSMYSTLIQPKLQAGIHQGRTGYPERRIHGAPRHNHHRAGRHRTDADRHPPAAAHSVQGWNEMQSEAGTASLCQSSTTTLPTHKASVQPSRGTAVTEDRKVS